jgi:hypothetical protein
MSPLEPICCNKTNPSMIFGSGTIWNARRRQPLFPAPPTEWSHRYGVVTTGGVVILDPKIYVDPMRRA